MGAGVTQAVPQAVQRHVRYSPADARAAQPEACPSHSADAGSSVGPAPGPTWRVASAARTMQ